VSFSPTTIVFGSRGLTSTSGSPAPVPVATETSTGAAAAPGAASRAKASMIAAIGRTWVRMVSGQR